MFIKNPREGKFVESKKLPLPLNKQSTHNGTQMFIQNPREGKFVVSKKPPLPSNKQSTHEGTQIFIKEPSGREIRRVKAISSSIQQTKRAIRRVN